MEFFDAFPDPWQSHLQETSAATWLAWIMLGIGLFVVVLATADFFSSLSKRGTRASLVRYGEYLPPGIFALLAGLATGSAWQAVWLLPIFFWRPIHGTVVRLALGVSRYRRPLVLFWRQPDEVLGPPEGHDQWVELAVGSNARLTGHLAEVNAWLSNEEPLERSFDRGRMHAAEGSQMRKQLLYCRRWYFLGAKSEDIGWVLLHVEHYRLPNQVPNETTDGFMALVDRIVTARFFQESLVSGQAPPRVRDLRFEVTRGTPMVSVAFPDIDGQPLHAHFMPLGQDSALCLTSACRSLDQAMNMDVLECFANAQARRWRLDDPDACLELDDWSGFRPTLTDHNAAV